MRILSLILLLTGLSAWRASAAAAASPAPATVPVTASATAPGTAHASAEAGVPAADDVVERHTDAEYRAAFFYALSCLAGMGNDHKDEAALLERALEVDPGSVLLMRERGEALLASGQAGDAAELMRKALDLAPGDLALRRKLSRVYQETDRVPLARALVLKPDGSDPDDPEWLRSLIGLDFVQDDYLSAERRLRILLAKGGSVDDQELLALTLERRQHWDEAAAQYRRVVAADPTRGSSWARLADCDDATGDTQASKADLQAGLKASPDSPLLADQLGRLQYRLEDYTGAEQAFSRLVDMDPTDAHSLLYRGLSRLKIRRYKEAEADFTALGVMQKDDPDQGYALALALMMQKKYGPAEEELRKVLKLSPRAEAAWAQLAFVDERQKRTDKAIASLKEGLKVLPNSEELFLLLSAAQEDNKDLAGAEQSLRDCLRRGGGDEVRFQLAVLLDKRGDFPGAEKELTTLIAESPKHAQALNYLGYSWVDKGVKLDQAEALIRRALAVDPGNRYYLDSLGWALYKEGRGKEALDPLTQAAQGVGKDADADADEAVVFDHLAAVQKDLGMAAEARLSTGKAEGIRGRAAKRATQDADPDRESGL